MKNKKAEAMVGLTGGQVAKLVAAAIAILILIYLGSIIANYFLDQTNKQKADAELNEIVPLLQQAEETSEEKEHFVIYAPKWFLFSSEFSNLCDEKFCLCLCEDRGCAGTEARSCIGTEKFVLIKEGGKTKRSIELKERPARIKLKYVDQTVYPYNAGKDIDRGWIEITTTTPIFFKFTDQWLWSPDFEENWRGASDYSNDRHGRSLSENNKLFIKDFLLTIKDSKTKGEELFTRTGAKLSEGVYVIEQ